MKRYTKKHHKHNSNRLFKYKVIINGQEIKEPQNFLYGFRGSERFFTLYGLRELTYTFEGKRYLTRDLIYSSSKTMENRFYPYSSYSKDRHANRPLKSIRFVRVPIKDTRKQRTEEERQERREYFLRQVKRRKEVENDNIKYYENQYQRDLERLKETFERDMSNTKKKLSKYDAILKTEVTNGFD